MSLKAKEKVDTNRYELQIEIDGETFRKAINKMYKKNVGKMNIPGFRKGKAPYSIIEKLYGENVFYEDALNDIYPAALDNAAEEAGIEIVDNNIEFDLVTMDKNGIDFKVKVTVKPEVTLGEYKGLSVEKPSADATAEEIDEEITRLQDRNSRMITVDREVKDGDTAVIDFEGFVDDVAFEGGKGESYSLKIGSGSFIPGFEDQIIGHKTEDEFDVNVSFPEDYQAADLAGKEAVFKVKVHEVKEKELPAIDDEFVKDVSEFDTLDELKADFAKKITEKKEKQAETAVETALIDQLLEGFQAEIPEAMFETRIDENLRDMDARLRQQGMNLQQYIQYMGGDVAGLRDSFREHAEKEVKVRLALEKVAQLEGIVPTEEDIKAEYDRFVETFHSNLETVKASIPEKELVKDLAVQKAVEIIKSSAVIIEKVDKSDEE
ncbi:MAG: trigger factor [Clostridiales bacterium 43-6]|nr:MAG: trigger factor [Clostridiales bacterium 43-6]